MKYTPRQKEIRALLKTSTIAEVAAQLGISAQSVRNVLAYVPTGRPAGRPPKAKVKR